MHKEKSSVKNYIITGGKWLGLTLLLTLSLAACDFPGSISKNVLAPEEAKAKAEKFINENLVQPGSQAEVKEIIDQGDFYKLVVDLSGSNIDSYLSKDGKIFFPQGMEIEETTAEGGDNNSSAATVQVANKTDKPVVELFIMSHCPYGTQIEKGIIPAVKALGDKMDFQLKFVDYAMHDKTELDEQLTQYCIRQEQPDKLLDYLECFLADGDSGRCLTETGINQTQLNTCIAAADQEYQVTAGYNDKNSWLSGNYPAFNIDKADNDKYGVQGSPTLIINGEEISSGRDSASLLAVICSAFNNQPEECSQQLSSVSPAAGFGYDGSSTGADGSCN